MNDIDKVILDIQQAAFNYYESYYAKYYEIPFQVIFENNVIQKPHNGMLHPPLNIDTKEKHFWYMKRMLGWIRILDGNTLVIPIPYALDEEHGLELKIVNNKVKVVGELRKPKKAPHSASLHTGYKICKTSKAPPRPSSTPP
ncbi:MAG: hypothetical protein IPK77_03920 [Cellvibrio sp.]|nr:hypothetical protein [Cellvibrio sp.]